MKKNQAVFVIVMVAVMIGVLFMGFSFYRSRKKSMVDRSALEKLNASLVKLIETNLKEWDAGIKGGTSELMGKDGIRGHQLNLEIHTAEKFSEECRNEIEKTLEADRRDGWLVAFTAEPDGGRVVFSLIIYTVPPKEAADSQ